MKVKYTILQIKENNITMFNKQKLGFKNVLMARYKTSFISSCSGDMFLALKERSNLRVLSHS